MVAAGGAVMVRISLGDSISHRSTVGVWLPPKRWVLGSDTLPETNLAPENGWLEDDPFLLGFGPFSGALLVLGRVIHDGGYFLCFSPKIIQPNKFTVIKMQDLTLSILKLGYNLGSKKIRGYVGNANKKEFGKLSFVDDA